MGLAGMGGHTFFLVTPHKLSFTVPPRNCAPRYGPNRDYYSLFVAFNYDKIYDIGLLLRLVLMSVRRLAGRARAKWVQRLGWGRIAAVTATVFDLSSGGK